MNDIQEKLNQSLELLLALDKKSSLLFSEDLKVIAEKIHSAYGVIKKQLEEKEKEVERLNDELKLNRADAIKYKQDFDEKCCTVANLADDVEQLQSQLSEKDKELSELKAKHEKDVKNAWQKGSESWIRGAQTAEQYYNQTHGQ